MHETDAQKADRWDRDIQWQLRADFREKERLEAELLRVNGSIQELGKLYWKHRGYTVIPRIERLRAAILGA